MDVSEIPAEMIACGIVVGVWRDALEPLHYRLSNAEMAYTSIASTVAVVEHCAGGGSAGTG